MSESFDETLETLEREGGNTKTPSLLEKKQTTQRVHWFFTWNNYQKEDIETLETFFRDICSKYCFQEETGKCGTPHLQGTISLKKRARWEEFGLPKVIHWEKVAHLTLSYLYCSKEESRTGKVFTMNYKIPKKLKFITPDKPWQIEILKIIETEPDDRLVYWFWSKAGGIGKSQFAKLLVAKHDSLFFEEGKKSDIMNLIFNADMDEKSCCVIDVPRANGNNVSYKSIESIKNGMIYSSKYEGGYKLFNSPHVIVFANAEPKYEALSKDRWKVFNIDEIAPSMTCI